MLLSFQKNPHIYKYTSTSFRPCQVY